ncbi:MAG TPA: hypothetical protein VIU93_07600 [Gallionellaceae bacterium]
MRTPSGIWTSSAAVLDWLHYQARLVIEMISVATDPKSVLAGTTPQAGGNRDCQLRKLGTDLFVCLEGKACTFAVPYGYLAFCKHPNVQSWHTA